MFSFQAALAAFAVVLAASATPVVETELTGFSFGKVVDCGGSDAAVSWSSLSLVPDPPRGGSLLFVNGTGTSMAASICYYRMRIYFGNCSHLDLSSHS